MKNKVLTTAEHEDLLQRQIERSRPADNTKPIRKLSQKKFYYLVVVETMKGKERGYIGYLQDYQRYVAGYEEFSWSRDISHARIFDRKKDANSEATRYRRKMKEYDNIPKGTYKISVKSISIYSHRKEMDVEGRLKTANELLENGRASLEVNDYENALRLLSSGISYMEYHFETQEDFELLADLYETRARAHYSQGADMGGQVQLNYSKEDKQKAQEYRDRAALEANWGKS